MAEHVGNWTSHLDATEEMLPYFHSSVHFPYSKVAHMCLQEAINLQKTMTLQDNCKFVEQGSFCMRRSSKCWSGIPMDMYIEQSQVACNRM